IGDFAELGEALSQGRRDSIDSIFGLDDLGDDPSTGSRAPVEPVGGAIVPESIDGLIGPGKSWSPEHGENPIPPPPPAAGSWLPEDFLAGHSTASNEAAASSAPGATSPVAAPAPPAPAFSWEEPGAATPRGPGSIAEAPAGRPVVSHEISDGELALLQALLQGLGLAELPGGAEGRTPGARRLTPELMQLIGRLLRVSTDGTVDLLQARAALKQEMRADHTMVAPDGNNPLKFAPDGQTALAQLLAPRAVRGFIGPVPAVRDAFD